MELTIRINDEDYERLSKAQKQGISAVLELNTVNAADTIEMQLVAAEEKKPKRASRKTKKETPDSSNNSDVSPNNNGGEEASDGNDTTDNTVGSNETTAAQQINAPKEDRNVISELEQNSAASEITSDVDLPSISAIQIAGAKFITAHGDKTSEFQELFKSFGMQKITDLESMPDKIPDFVEAIRAAGVEI